MLASLSDAGAYGTESYDFGTVWYEQEFFQLLLGKFNMYLNLKYEKSWLKY